MDDRRYICVYCGSKSGADPCYTEAAVWLGKSIAARGYGLVFGGGGIGLMGTVADAVLAEGSPVVGVIPRNLMAREVGHAGLTELLVVDDMHERKAEMTARASAFVAMAGGYGTLEELFEMVAWSQLEIHRRPIGLLNTAGYFDGLTGFLDHAVTEGFLHSAHRNVLQISSDPAVLLQELL